MEIIIYHDMIKSYPCCRIFSDKMREVTSLTIIQRSKNTKICDQQFGSFSKMFKSILDDMPDLEHLILKRINTMMFNQLDLYSTKLKTLTIAHSDISDTDMLLIGPCFTGINKLIWYMNRFNEALFEQFIDPYFDYDYNMEYENDDGWYPGCEIYGNGQSLQFKNESFYIDLLLNRRSFSN